MKIQGWMLRWLANALAVVLIVLLIPETYTEEGLFNYGMAASIWAALIGAVFIGIANAVIRPLLMLLGLPLNMINLGVVTLVLNALVLPLTVNTIKGFELSGWFWSFLAVLFISAISLLSSYFLDDREYWRFG